MATTMDPIVSSSALPILSLLDEQEPQLQSHALRSLETLTDTFWPEIFNAVPRILELSEDSDFNDRDLASLVASKVFFHVGELDEALKYALAAGELFDVGKEDEFASTLRRKCIDEYVRVRRESEGRGEMGGSSSVEDVYEKELEMVVNRLLEGCIEKGEIREAIGVALESRRLDRVEQAVLKGCKNVDERADALTYCFQCAQSLVAERGYRTKVVKLIGQMYAKEEAKDEVAIASCMAYVQDAEGVAKALVRLVMQEGSEEDMEDRELIALQIAFDIVDNDEPYFSATVSRLLSDRLKSLEISTTNQDDDGTAMDGTEEKITKDKANAEKLKKLQQVLKGTITAALSLDFLCRHNHSDRKALSRVQSFLDPRQSICHSALVFANACAHAGTAIDSFLRANLEWLARATAWAKFSATAGMGTIHARHWQASLSILSPYLPTASNIGASPSSASFSQGGALYALGLITACTGVDGNLKARKHIMDLLKEDSASQQNEVVVHGACLGLGLSSMAMYDGSAEEMEETEEFSGRAVYAELKERLMADSAAGGEAAGLGMGLVSVGSGAELVWQELLSYARETQHEKITRGSVVGIALIMYAREEEAEPCIEEMIRDKNSIIRYGACFTIGLAYCATGNNGAIRRLLHLAVSDVADEVRRAAIMNLGFVMLRQPEQVPEIVSLLSESCHDHVRYGSALAIGIACIGTGLPSAVAILNRLSTDAVDFVRQGAFISLALVYMHHNEVRSPEVVKFRQSLEKTISDKHEDIMARFGASVAMGIVDLGGKNAFIALVGGGQGSRGGLRRMRAIVGMALFLQSWFWYPMVHFISLCARPTGLIAIAKNLKMVKCEVSYEEEKEGMFDYVKNGLGGPSEKKKAPSRTLTAVLSVTAKSKAREAAKKKASEKKSAEGKGESPASDKAGGPEDTKEKKAMKRDKDGDVVMDGGVSEKAMNGAETKNGETTPKKKVLKNPCRVLPEQERLISWDLEGKTQRYRPVKRNAVTGVVVLKDLRKDEPQEYVPLKILAEERAPAATETGARDEEEVPMPEPFEYTDETQEVIDASQKPAPAADSDTNNNNDTSDGASG